MTGVGLVSPLGIGTDANWEALCAGQSGIGPITRFEAAQFSARIAGEVKDFDPLRFARDRCDIYCNTRCRDCGFRLVQFLLHGIEGASVGSCEVV